jgi:hypothetical protein
MKPFLITLSLFLLLWLSFGIYLFFFTSNSFFTFHTESLSGEVQKTYEEVVAEKQKVQEQDNLYYNTAIQTKNQILCDSIESTNTILECREKIQAINAVASGSIEGCDSLTLSGIALECRDALYQKTALESQSPALCNKLSNSVKSDFCHEMVDEKSLRILIASGSLNNDSCSQFATGSRSACLQFIQDNQANVVIKESIVSGSNESCSQIVSEADKILCNDTVNLRNALDQNNKSLCSDIADVGKKEYCMSHIDDKNQNNIFYKAIESNDVWACVNLTDMTLRDKCNDTIIFALVRSQKDANLCAGLKNTLSIPICQKLIAQ